MPMGKKIAENPELEAFVIELLKKGCPYTTIVERIKERFNIITYISRISGYKKNYMPSDIVLPKQKKGKSQKDIEKGMVPISEGEVLIKGDGVLNWYINSIARFEKQIDKFLKSKKEMNGDETKDFINLMNLQGKLHLQFGKLYKKDIIRKNEMFKFGDDILKSVMKVFDRIVPQEEKIMHQDFEKGLEESMAVISMRYFGE